MTSKTVLPVFIFDPDILKRFPNKNDFRLSYIFKHLNRMHAELSAQGSGMHWVYQNPLEFFKALLDLYRVEAVHCNEDYEPAAFGRDLEVKNFLAENGIPFYQWKDQVLLGPTEVLKPDGTPYKVFTPFSRAWKSKLSSAPFTNLSFPSEKLLHHLLSFQSIFPHFTLKSTGYNEIDIPEEKLIFSPPDLTLYHEQRDFPALNAGSGASVHLRFGTLSIRKLLNLAFSLKSDKFLNELIWREFYFTILHHFPHTVSNAFKPEYDRIEWKWNEDFFDAWCNGKTGFPLVDAGMRQLNETGEMHNRLRMVCASFFCKNLLLDWRLGEAYFAQKLNDYDLSANVGGWQWAAGCGCDAAPYFRIFNPITQQSNYDPELKYISRWIPEINTPAYPKPIVNLESSRRQCLNTYQRALKGI